MRRERRGLSKPLCHLAGKQFVRRSTSGLLRKTALLHAPNTPDCKCN